MQTVYEFSYAPTGRCNLSCIHCYTRPVTRRWLLQDSTPELAERIAEGILRFLDTERNYNVNITLTGGEPLLASYEVLHSFSRTLIDGMISRGNRNFGFVVNTNALVFRKEIEALMEYWSATEIVRLSISYDLEFRFSSGEQERKWFSFLEKFVFPYFEDRFTVCITINRKLFNFDIFDFAKKNGFRFLAFNSPSLTGNLLQLSERYQKVREMIPALNELSLFFIALNIAKPQEIHFYPSREDFYREVRQRIRTQGLLECWGSCYNAFLISPNGDVYVNGLCFSPVSFGNIIRDSTEKILNSKIRKGFIKWKTSRKICSGCIHSGFCRGGCVSLERINRILPSEECSGLKTYLDWVFHDVIPEDLGSFIERTFFKNYIINQ